MWMYCQIYGHILEISFEKNSPIYYIDNQHVSKFFLFFPFIFETSSDCI